VFFPLQSNSEVLGVPKDSQVPISGVQVSSSHSSKSGVVIIIMFEKVIEFQQAILLCYGQQKTIIL